MYQLSVVANPAMQDLWVAFAEHPEQIELAEVDEDKRLLLGAVLIPDKKIKRKVDDHEFYIKFSAETIEKVAHDFIKKGNQGNSSLEHKEKLEGMSVVEAWTVANPTNDKSNNYGKTYPKGSMVVMMKVDNDDIWSKVKSGEIKGFSIDALLGLQELKLNTNKINMSAETSKSIIDAITEKFDAIMVKLNGHKDKEGKLPEAIIELKAEFETKSEELKTEFETKVTEQETEFKKIKVELSEKVKEIEKLDDLSKEIAELKVELGKAPEVDPIKGNPEGDTKVFNKGTFPKNGRSLIEDRINQALWGS